MGALGSPVLKALLTDSRKEKAAKFSVPLPKVRGISEEEVFKVIKSGKKTHKKSWKRMIAKVCYITLGEITSIMSNTTASSLPSLAATSRDDQSNTNASSGKLPDLELRSSEQELNLNLDRWACVIARPTSPTKNWALQFNSQL